MKTLSVIIVNYNVKHFLEQCLLSVKKAVEGIESEVYVVDNNSVDGSQQMLREKFPWVKLIDNRKNVGFSKANNQAIRISTGKYVLLLNPDTIVEETTFSKSIQFMEDHEDAGALGVKMLDGKGKFLPESKRALPTPWVAFYKIFGLARIFPRSKRFGKYHLSYLDNDSDHSVEVLSGAFMLMRNSVLDKIGLLDEDFFMYGEDIDLSYRVTQAGYKNYYFAGTKIIHYKGESTKKGSLNYVRVFYNAMIIFARKHFSADRQRFYISLIRLAVYFRAFLAILNRIWKKVAFPLAEVLLVYGAAYGIKEYWEYIHKIPRDSIPYPAEFDYIAAPVYSLVLIGFLWIAGGYRRPYRVKPIQTAALAGFIAIATVSFVFPSINFSRMIVGLSSISMALIALLNRNIMNYLKTGNFFFTEENKRRIVLVGSNEEVDRISRLIRGELNYQVEIEGTVRIEEEQQAARDDSLGTIAQLDEITAIYKVDEVVFSNKSISTERILDIMSGLHSGSVDYKIVPPDVNYLVGPQVIHDSLLEQPLFYNLGRKENMLRKRVFDVLSSGTLLLFFPIHFWLHRRPGAAFRNLWNVLRGEYHLVGYIRTDPPGLPHIKRGLLNMLHRVKSKSTSDKEEHSKGLDRHYARSYSVEMDIEILLKGIRNIGEA